MLNAMTCLINLGRSRPALHVFTVNFALNITAVKLYLDIFNCLIDDTNAY